MLHMVVYFGEVATSDIIVRILSLSAETNANDSLIIDF